MKKEIDENIYDKALDYYNGDGKVLHNELYSLCEDPSDHSDFPSVYAKVCIIGRGYATGIERQIGKVAKNKALEGLERRRNQTGIIIGLSDHLHDNIEVKSIFDDLSSITGALDTDELNKIIHLHGQFTTLISKICRTRKNGQKYSPRCFAAKYMHFHNPLVPIFDSIANKELKTLCNLNETSDLQLSKDGDKKYYNFVRRFWELYKAIGKKKWWDGVNSSAKVKIADNYLIFSSEESKKK